MSRALLYWWLITQWFIVEVDILNTAYMSLPISLSQAFKWMTSILSFVKIFIIMAVNQSSVHFKHKKINKWKATTVQVKWILPILSPQISTIKISYCCMCQNNLAPMILCMLHFCLDTLFDCVCGRFNSGVVCGLGKINWVFLDSSGKGLCSYVGLVGKARGGAFSVTL